VGDFVFVSEEEDSESESWRRLPSRRLVVDLDFLFVSEEEDSEEESESWRRLLRRGLVVDLGDAAVRSAGFGWFPSFVRLLRGGLFFFVVVLAVSFRMAPLVGTESSLSSSSEVRTRSNSELPSDDEALKLSSDASSELSSSSPPFPWRRSANSALSASSFFVGGAVPRRLDLRWLLLVVVVLAGDAMDSSSSFDEESVSKIIVLRTGCFFVRSFWRESTGMESPSSFEEESVSMIIVLRFSFPIFVFLLLLLLLRAFTQTVFVRRNVIVYMMYYTLAYLIKINRTISVF